MRIAITSAENQMIQELNLKRVSRFRELMGNPYVCGARRRIPTGVVMDTDHGGGTNADGAAEYFSRMDEAGGGGATRDLVDAFEAIANIQ